MEICSPFHFQPPWRPLPLHLLQVTAQPRLIRLSARETGHSASVSQNEPKGFSCLGSTGAFANLPAALPLRVARHAASYHGPQEHEPDVRRGKRGQEGEIGCPEEREQQNLQKGGKSESPNHGLSQARGSWGAQEKDVRPPALTHLPAAIPVGQEPERYAEDHVAKKHHLRGIEAQLRRPRSQQDGAALPFELWASRVFSKQQDELQRPEP